MRRSGPSMAGLVSSLALVSVVGMAAPDARAATSTAAATAGATTARLAPSCPGSLTPGKLDYHGLPLTMCNFNGADLTNANFAGATLTGVAFIKAKLAGADFSGATFLDDGHGAMPTDFSFADLTGAKFVDAHFNGATYLTYATLTCADFSKSDLSAGGNAIFGATPLVFDASQACLVSFREAKMNCEFVDQWRRFDLTGADVKACSNELAGRNFNGATLGGVDLSSLNLDGAQFAGAQLPGAQLDNASLQCGPAQDGSGNRCVDLSNANLQGASLNKADLSGASLYKAFLSNSNGGNAASLRQAHLKNVNLSNAQLSGVDFTLANFYGSSSANLDNGCGIDAAGFTKDCASASSATLSATLFAGAYLYGVDFSAATIAGVNFDQAVLSGANFNGAQIGTLPQAAKRTLFTRAHLEGTNLDVAGSVDADLTDAFLDFSGANNFFVLLDGANHNRFACGPKCRPPSGKDVCVVLSYPKTTVPGSNPHLTCPDGLPAGADGCGTGGSRWQSSLDPAMPPPGVPPAWYQSPPSFGRPTTATICNGQAPVSAW